MLTFEGFFFTLCNLVHQQPKLCNTLKINDFRATAISQWGYQTYNKDIYGKCYKSTCYILLSKESNRPRFKSHP